MLRKKGFRNPQFDLIGPTGGPIDEFNVIAETLRAHWLPVRNICLKSYQKPDHDLRSVTVLT